MYRDRELFLSTHPFLSEFIFTNIAGISVFIKRFIWFGISVFFCNFCYFINSCCIIFASRISSSSPISIPRNKKDDLRSECVKTICIKLQATGFRISFLISSKFCKIHQNQHILRIVTYIDVNGSWISVCYNLFLGVECCMQNLLWSWRSTCVANGWKQNNKKVSKCLTLLIWGERSLLTSLIQTYNTDIVSVLRNISLLLELFFYLEYFYSRGCWVHHQSSCFRLYGKVSLPNTFP